MNIPKSVKNSFDKVDDLRVENSNSESLKELDVNYIT